MSRYGRILRTPNVAMLFAATTLARIPFGVNGLAVLLFLREVSGSFAIAGLGAGALALGAGLGAPFAARLVDRRGAGMLMPLAIGHAVGLAALFALGEVGAPGALLVATAAVIGTSFPPSGSVLRSRWPRILGDPELVASAYALDSVIVELSFITGPLITAAIVALAGPGAALFFSAALVIIGTALFIAVFPRSLGEAEQGGFHGILGALAIPAVRVVALTTLPIGFCLGAIEVVLPAFSHAEGRDELSGVFLALWSVGSAIGGFTFGARAGADPRLTNTYMWVALACPLACLPLAAASSPLAVGFLAVLAGLPVAPLIATRNQLLSQVVPDANATEAFTWLMTSLIAGLAAGAAMAGLLVEADGWPTAVLVGVGVGITGAVLSVARRSALVPAPAVG